ncbi:hypothetical protein ANCCAN_14158 [Ancylostoma caninum]|uniref:Uncharacterized protein n=1 Tax=Ancylostoma caninum TaxID=29170 RepID=A0A368G9B7_ANCCA|nr:hypothetical protein ANCCAN_14158 [Ancylostoma caninum]
MLKRNTVEKLVRRRKIDGGLESEKTENPDPKNIPRFRPFGILEPLPAKEARKSILTVLQIVCELASVQGKIKAIDSRILEVKQAMKGDDEVCRAVLQVLHI